MSIKLTDEQIARRELIRSFRSKYSNIAEFNALYPNDSLELALLDKLYEAGKSHAREDEKYTELMRVGKSAADSLRAMVAALECDYDRLEELREEKANYDDEIYVQLLWDERPEGKELAALEAQAGECESREDAEQRIQEDALSVEMRGDWYGASGDGKEDPPIEFKILLSTGGPATQICGELSNGEPQRAWLEVQDWGTPWTEYREDGLSEVLLAYARCFYFGEG